MIQSTKTPESGIISMCCGTRGCPTIDFTDKQKIVIRDDFGGQVQLTPDEWNFLKTKFAFRIDQE